MTRSAVGASPRRLSGQDLAFLAWESGTRPMHVAVVAEFRAGSNDRSPDLAALRQLLGERVRRETVLISRLERRFLRRPRLVRQQDLNIEDHVRDFDSAWRSGESLEARESRVLAASLDPNRPMWEIWLDRLDDSSFRLLIKLHHALVDGAAAVALLERLFGGIEPAVARPVEAQPPVSPPARRQNGIGLGEVALFVRDQLRGGPSTRLTGRVGAARHHEELRFDAASLRCARERFGVSGNDVLVAAVAGALRRWFLRSGGDALPSGLRAFCPVSLRARDATQPTGNHIAPWYVPLPVTEASLEKRLLAVHFETSALKRRGAERGGAGMARLVRALGPWLAWLGMSLAAWRRAFGVVVTNLPGPRAPLVLHGATMTSIRAHPPLFPGQRLAVSIVHYQGRLFIGLIDGWTDVASGRAFAEDLAVELRAVLNQGAASADKVGPPLTSMIAERRVAGDV